MSEIEFIPNYIYTVLILPIIVLFQKHFSVSSRVTVLESKDKIDDEKFGNICTCLDELTKEVHEMLGRWDEHKH